MGGFETTYRQCSFINGTFWFPARPERVFNRPENITGSPTGIERAMSRIENEGERRRGPKDAVYGWTLFNEF
jgi:hypothetical protein